jgi:hypothetical protein
MNKFIEKRHNINSEITEYVFHTEFGHIVITDYDIFNFDIDCYLGYEIESDSSSFSEIQEATDYIRNNFKERNGKYNE